MPHYSKLIPYIF